MGIKWENIKIGLSPITNEIYIGKCKIVDETTSEWTDKSGALTNEMISVVSEHLRYRCEDEEQFKDGIELAFKNGAKLSYTPPKPKQ